MMRAYAAVSEGGRSTATARCHFVAIAMGARGLSRL